MPRRWRLPRTPRCTTLPRCCAEQLKPDGDLTSLDTNMVVMQILDAARESAHTGKTVVLHPLPQ